MINMPRHQTFIADAKYAILVTSVNSGEQMVIGSFAEAWEAQRYAQENPTIQWVTGVYVPLNDSGYFRLDVIPIVDRS